jgi:hypothetical protein
MFLPEWPLAVSAQRLRGECRNAANNHLLPSSAHNTADFSTGTQSGAIGKMNADDHPNQRISRTFGLCLTPLLGRRSNRLAAYHNDKRANREQWGYRWQQLVNEVG